MFSHIMAPVDLAHLGMLERALEATGDLARHWGASITYVSVSSSAPSSLAHTPEEFEAKLARFAEEQSNRHGAPAKAHAVISHDPAVDKTDALMRAVDEIGADVVVMASHKPGLADYFWSGNGAKVSSGAAVSVFVVRDA